MITLSISSMRALSVLVIILSFCLANADEVSNDSPDDWPLYGRSHVHIVANRPGYHWQPHPHLPNKS